MTPSPDWRMDLSPGIRFQNVQNIQKIIQIAGEASSSNAKKAGIAAETEAYNISTSRDQYDSICSTITNKAVVEPISEPPSHSIALRIGKYTDCSYVASGAMSEVYKSKMVALKVIQETQELQPHSPSREVKILLQTSHRSIIKFIEVFKDQQGRLVLAFPYMPLTLANIMESHNCDLANILSCFKGLLSALDYLHAQGIIHRDVKPSNLLLATASGPAYLADFGTAWHPSFSTSDEPADYKVLDVGTTCYRTPEVLFGNRSYDASLDIWAAGAMLAECLRTPPKPLFESRDCSEDGNQLGLILSIFKTLGTPTKETWPEALHFPTPPFEWYRVFPGHSWEELLPNSTNNIRSVVSRMVCYQTTDRLTAKTAAELLG